MLEEFIQANGYNATKSRKFLALKNHSPFKSTVPTVAIRDSFYNKVNALQGERYTWWTGAAWQAHDSSQTWNWTEHTLLPRIIDSH